MKKKQIGGSLIETLVSVTILSIVFSIIATNYVKYQRRKTIEIQMERFQNTIALVQQYTYRNGRPNNLNQVLTKGYSFQCGIHSECTRLDITNWNTRVTLNHNSDLSSYWLSFKMPSVRSTRSTVTGFLYNSFPMISIDGNNAKIIINLLDNKGWTISQPSDDIDVSAYIHQDGSTKLTSDWNVGDHAITNVKDVTLSIPNHPAISVSNGLIRSSGYAKSGSKIKMPICNLTNGEKPIVITWFNGIAPSNSGVFSNISSIYANAYPSIDNKHWLLNTRFVAYSNDKHKFILYNDINESQTLDDTKDHADVLMGYITMCKNDEA